MPFAILGSIALTPASLSKPKSDGAFSPVSDVADLRADGDETETTSASEVAADVGSNHVLSPNEPKITYIRNARK